MSSATKERIVSSDSHVTVTHDAVKSNLASKFHEGYDAAVEQMGGGGVATRRGQNTMPFDLTKVNHAFGRPGTHDGKERLIDMDADGVDVEVLYCEFSAFRYLYLIKDGWREATQAFNNTLADFASVDPSRLICSYQIPIHDIDIAVAEVKRVAEIGGKSLQLPVHPPELGLPDYWERHWDPLWAAIQESGIPACFHIGLANVTVYDPFPNDHAQGVVQPIAAFWTSIQYGNFIMGGVFERFPKLKCVFVEPGIGWFPWWLNNADQMVLDRGYSFPQITELPSFYFKRNLFLTFIDEPESVKNLRHLMIDNIMWSTDYPHPACSWPRSQEIIEAQFEGVPADDRYKILSGNADRVWNLSS
ncbi:MAG TPA: amidohydrolase family protein [Acidimicrobiales bacterium]|nr:amidohydrolase family protein [Acidimicrobiales bacterium]